MSGGEVGKKSFEMYRLLVRLKKENSIQAGYVSSRHKLSDWAKQSARIE